MKKFGVGLAAVIVIVAALAGLAWWLEPTWVAALAHDARHHLGTAIVLGLVLLAVAAGVGAEAADQRRLSARDRGRDRSGAWVGAGWLTAVLLVVAAVAFGGWAAWTGGYRTAHGYVAAGAVRVVTTPAPDFGPRAPWDVAVASEPSALGDVVGEPVDASTTYIPEQGKYTTLVEKKSWLGAGHVGYASVIEQTVPQVGQVIATHCDFSPAAGKSLTGWFGHSLTKAITHRSIAFIVDKGDAYGYCDRDTPKVVIPVKKLVGVFPALEQPAGVFVYDGTTGALDYLAQVRPGQVLGPVFPTSLAKDLREATAALGSVSDYRSKRVGYEDTSRDEKDPNGANRSEFVLAQGTATTGAPAYVTPLTPRGRGTAIVALGTVDASTVTAGRWNTFNVYKLPVERKANSAVESRIRSDYGDLPEWAAGMQVFEVVPGAHGDWAASLGKDQTLLYRVLVQADGSSCLTDPTGRQLRCGRRTVDGSGVALGDQLGTGAGVGGQVPADLAKLSNAQLAALAQQLAAQQAQVSAELGRRLNATK